MLEQTTAYLRVLDFEDGVLDVGFLETIESDYDAVDLGKRVIDFSFGSTVGEFYLLEEICMLDPKKPGMKPDFKALPRPD